MEYLLDIYPATRNRMPHSWLGEIHRGEETEPGTPKKEYVQWQRGPLSDVPMKTMKSWVDTLLEHDNIWLVLVFHGVDGIGWQPRTSEDLETYFKYIKEKENDLWVGTLGDVSKYIRQRMNAEVHSSNDGEKIVINLTQTLDPDTYLEPEKYDQDLTLKTYVPDGWAKVQVRQNGETQNVKPARDGAGLFIVYDAKQNAGPVELWKGNSRDATGSKMRYN